MAALFRGGRTRVVILRLATDYERMADQAAMLDLQDADRDAEIIPSNMTSAFTPKTDI